MTLFDPTGGELVDAFNALTLRVEALEALALRRPTEPIPQSIIQQAIDAQTPPPVAEPEPEQPTNDEPEA